MYTKFNANYDVYVKLKDNGIKHYIKEYNENMPIEYQKSFNEVKKFANEDGYHKFQLHFFMDIFGKQGMALSDLIDLNILFSTSQLSNVSEDIK